MVNECSIRDSARRCVNKAKVSVIENIKCDYVDFKELLVSVIFKCFCRFLSLASSCEIMVCGFVDFKELLICLDVVVGLRA